MAMYLEDPASYDDRQFSDRQNANGQTEMCGSDCFLTDGHCEHCDGGEPDYCEFCGSSEGGHMYGCPNGKYG